MSSETSTEHGRHLPATPSSTAPGMHPWQFFVLAGLGCATAITFLLRGQGFTVVVLASVLMAATTLVGMAALRAVRPLVSPHDDRGAVVGRRTRAALEQEKASTLRTIKELEFDRAMGKMSEEDFREMSARLRARAARLIKQLDAGSGYRTRIEKDLATRLGEAHDKATAAVPRNCPACATPNDADARFCKNCGERLG
jgi:hypothetical protein